VQFLHKFGAPCIWGGSGGPRPILGLSARMCLACAFDLMSRSVHSRHHEESIGVVSAQVEEKLGSSE
jgi:hypothetical protein